MHGIVSPRRCSGIRLFLLTPLKLGLWKMERRGPEPIGNGIEPHLTATMDQQPIRAACYDLNVPHRSIIILGTVVALSIAARGCLDPCGNKVLVETPSPGNEKRAVLFQRDCGATTDFSIHLSVLNRSEALPRSAGNVFVADADHGKVAMDVHTRWESSDHLIVDFPAPARVLQKRERANGVRVSYHAYDVR
jgi:hypothetical protein